MTPRDIADTYVALLNAEKFDQVGDLWAEDGELLNGFGQVIKGKRAIAAFYAAFKDHDFPRVRAVSYTEDKETNVCAVELETTMIWDENGNAQPGAGEDFAPASVDLFTVNAAGKVQKMVAYIAPPNKWLTS